MCAPKILLVREALCESGERRYSKSSVSGGLNQLPDPHFERNARSSREICLRNQLELAITSFAQQLQRRRAFVFRQVVTVARTLALQGNESRQGPASQLPN